MNFCENCKKEHNGMYGSGRFCSIKCSKSFSTKDKRKEINEKISNTLKGNGNPDVKLTCKNCENNFEINWKKRHQLFCSRSCSTKWKNKHIGISRLGGLSSASKSTLRSKNEILFFNLCNNYFDNVQHNISLFNGWDADVVLTNEKIAILWNGVWHYKQITKKHSVEQVQNRDRIKIKEIKNMGYTPYIIKDMGKYNPKFVNEEFNKFLNYIARRLLVTHRSHKPGPRQFNSVPRN